MKFLKNFVASALATLLIVALYHFIVTSKAQSQGAPVYHQNVGYLDTADNGFSRGWKDFQRADPQAWFDIHMHVSRKCSTVDLQKKAFKYWSGILGELDFVGGAIMGGPDALYDYAQNDTTVFPFARFGYKNPDAEKLEWLVREKGVRGLKMHNRPMYRDKADYRLRDSKKWNAVYAKCGDLGIPILWHINQRHRDPHIVHGANTAKTWAALDYTNQDVLDLFEKIAAKHRNTNFIMAHGNFMGNDSLAALFDRHSNVFTDGSSEWKLSRGHNLTPQERARLRPFFVKYQDRLLFGTDFSIHIRTKNIDPIWQVNKYDTYTHFLLQLELPAPALSKIAYKNALGLLEAKAWFAQL